MKNTTHKKRNFVELHKGLISICFVAILMVISFSGTANAQPYADLASIPPADFCTSGTAILQVENATTITWTCEGSGAGTDANCTANRIPTGSCEIRHPAAWTVGGNTCVEYFAAAGTGNVSISYLAAGQTRMYTEGYCGNSVGPGSSCYGEWTIRCDSGGSGGITVISETCTAGLRP